MFTLDVDLFEVEAAMSEHGRGVNDNIEGPRTRFSCMLTSAANSKALPSNRDLN